MAVRPATARLPASAFASRTTEDYRSFPFGWSGSKEAFYLDLAEASGGPVLEREAVLVELHRQPGDRLRARQRGRGARPLKRLIQREVQDPLALRLLSGEIHEGGTVVVEADGDELTLRSEPASSPVGDEAPAP